MTRQWSTTSTAFYTQIQRKSFCFLHRWAFRIKTISCKCANFGQHAKYTASLWRARLAACSLRNSAKLTLLHGSMSPDCPFERLHSSPCLKASLPVPLIHRHEAASCLGAGSQGWRKMGDVRGGTGNFNGDGMCKCLAMLKSSNLFLILGFDVFVHWRINPKPILLLHSRCLSPHDAKYLAYSLWHVGQRRMLEDSLAWMIQVLCGSKSRLKDKRNSLHRRRQTKPERESPWAVLSFSLASKWPLLALKVATAGFPKELLQPLARADHCDFSELSESYQDCQSQQLSIF